MAAKRVNKRIRSDPASDVSRLGSVLEKDEPVGDISPENAAEHLMRCQKCHNYFDMRDLRQILLHKGPLPHPSEARG